MAADTLLQNFTTYVTGNKQFANRVVCKECKKSVLEFEKSDDNNQLSIATFYASGVIGKRKYKSVRLALSMKSNESKKQVFQFVKAVTFHARGNATLCNAMIEPLTTDRLLFGGTLLDNN